jgi:hypothetical protein
MRFRAASPSPALVVAVIALIVALGGTGYAAVVLPAHSVGKKQLKRHAVTTNKIHRNAITGSKVKNNTLTGRDINEQKLGEVPAAQHAESAVNAAAALRAGSAATAGNAAALQGHGAADFVSSGAYQQILFKLQAGDTRELVRNGPVSIYARCATVAGDDTLRMYAKTDVNGAIMLTAWGDTLDGSTANDFLNTTTPEAQREWDNSAGGDPAAGNTAITPTGVTKIVDHWDASYLIAPTGQAIAWESEAELLTFNYLGARCLIAGTVHRYQLK